MVGLGGGGAMDDAGGDWVQIDVGAAGRERFLIKE